MRTYGRTGVLRATVDASSTLFSADTTLLRADTDLATPWAEVDTDENGDNDAVWLTTLVQVLKLNLNESPFFASYGIPAYESVVQQVFPDYYVALTQQLFAQYFASLLITRQLDPTPTYVVTVVTNEGVKVSASIPI